MLVVRRRPGEVLVIGEDIEIEILEAAGSQVKLGIRAPRSIPVARKELYLVRQQNRAAASPAGANAVDQLLDQLARRGRTAASDSSDPRR